MPRNLDDEDWQLLLQRINRGRCIPLIGPEAYPGAYFSPGGSLARLWASELEHYPLQDRNDLARVAQYLATKHNDRLYAKLDLVEEVKKIQSPNFTDREEPHGLLADLPLRVYLTTNYDDLMLRALQSRLLKSPRQDHYPWTKEVPEPALPATEGAVDVATPLVYHLFGRASVPESLVVTEDDYLEFLVNFSAESERRLPASVRNALPRSSLVLLGYRLTDWNFRILCHSFSRYFKSKIMLHMAVQVEPSEVGATEKQMTTALDYHERYFFQDWNVRVFWGTCRDFTRELRRHWEAR